MKKLLVAIFMLVASVVAFAADKTTAVFTLDHQMSQMCEKKIKTNLRYEKGVSNIDVSLTDNTITITYATDKTDPDRLIEGFKKIGFNATLVDGKAPCCRMEQGKCCKAEQKSCCK